MARRQVVGARVRQTVIDLWGNECWLNLPGCTKVGEEDDHIIPFKAGGQGTVANIRRACKHCNISRSNRVLSGYGATLHVVMGPPCAGKSSYVAEHAGNGALILDFDRLAEALMLDVDVKHEATGPLVATAQGAWQGAYNKLARMNAPVEVWLIKSLPSTRSHPRLLDEWLALDYELHVVVPGASMVFDRLTAEHRNEGAKLTARQWYSLHLTQELLDARQRARRARLAALGLRDQCERIDARPQW